MNCFSHAIRFLDRDAYFVVGTCVPDWLSMVARKTRVREKLANAFVADPRPEMAQLSQGIVQHHQDDHWFHSLPTFVQLNLQLSIELRDLLGSDAGFRPHLVGHVLIEVLMDGYLHSNNPGQLDRYYELVKSVDAEMLQNMINQIAKTPTDNVVPFLPKFITEAYLYDYIDDQRVHYRLNRVLNRVKLSSLPDSFLDWLPSARQRVYDLAPVLLTPPKVAADNSD